MPCRGRHTMKHSFPMLARAFAGGVDACEGRASRRSAVPPSCGFPEGGEKRSGKNKWVAETKERTPDLPEWSVFFRDPAGGIAFGKDVTCQHMRGQRSVRGAPQGVRSVPQSQNSHTCGTV